MSEAPAGRRLGLLLALYFLILLIPAGFLPLMESTEGRYGEIAWEMLLRHNYLEPFFGAIKHFHKPPLTYWAVAGGYQLFGIGDFGARFFGIVAAVIAVAYLYRLALVLLGERRDAFDAALIFASSILFLAIARVVATDIYLTCFTVMAQYYLFRRLRGERRSSDAPLYGLALGLGFLTKGPIIFLFTLLPYLVAKFFDPDHRRVFSWREVAAGTGVFALFALPWYIAVMIENPGLLYYFLKVQTVDRVATNRFHRHEPIWYFFYVFAGTFVPYILFFVRGTFKPRAFARPTRVLLLYVWVPFIVFTLAQSKQPTYILPFFGIAAVFSAAALRTFAMPRLRTLAALLLLLFAVAPAAAGFVYPPARVLRWPLLASLLPLLPLWWQLWRQRQGAQLVWWSGLLLLAASTVGYAVLAVAAPQMRGYEQMAQALNRLDPERKIDVVAYQAFLPSLSLYRRHLTAAAYGMDRDVRFQTDDEYRHWYLPTPADLQRFLATRPQVFVVTSEDGLPDFEAESGYACREVYGQRKRSAYLCHAPQPTPAPAHQPE